MNPRITAIQTLTIVFLLLACVITTTAAEEENKIKISLPQAIEWAITRNRSVIRSSHNIRVGQLGLKSAKTDFDIKLTPSGGVRTSDENNSFATGLALTKKFTHGYDISVSPGIVVDDDNYYSRIGISLNIPLLNRWGKLVNLSYVKSEEYTVRMTQRELFRTKTNIIIQAVTSFYRIILFQHTVKLNSSLVASFKKHAKLAKLKSDVGVANPLDVYRAKIKVKDAEADLVTSIESLQNEKNELKSLLSIPQARKIALNEPAIKIDMIALNLSEAETIALENSIEIRQAIDALNEARRFSKIAKRDLLPDLLLSFNYSLSGESEELRDTFDMRDERWSVSLSSTTDFARSREKLYYKQTLINIDSAKIDLDDTKDKIQKDVRSQLDILNKIKKQIKIRKQQIHQAEGKKDLSQIKFNNNMADNFDLIEAETELHQARLNLLQADIDYIINTYRLREIMGTLLAYDEK